MADPTAELIERLLASGKVSRETREELGTFKQDLSNGQLDGGDRRYVEALAARLLGVGRPANDDRVTSDSDAVDEDEEAADDDESLWDVGEDPETAALRERAEAAEARVAELEAEIASLKGQASE